MKGIMQLVSISMLLLAVACGGGSSGGGNKGGGGGASVDGVFVDSVVTGLRYESPSNSGVTDANGKFTCTTDEVVEFYLPATGGNLYVGEVKCRAVVSPIELVTDGAKTVEDGLTALVDAGEEMVVKRALRLLQTLDSDGNPTNGITLVQTEVDAMITTLAITDRDEDLTNALQDGTLDFDQALTNVAAALPFIGVNARVAVSEVAATAHFNTTISTCSTSGCTTPLPATRSCDVSNGEGTQTLVNGSYGSCVATSCDSGFSINNGQCEAVFIDSGYTCLEGRTVMDNMFNEDTSINTANGSVIGGRATYMTRTLVVIHDDSTSVDVYRPTVAIDQSNWLIKIFKKFSATYSLDTNIGGAGLMISNIGYSNDNTADIYFPLVSSLAAGVDIQATSNSTGVSGVNLDWSVSRDCELPEYVIPLRP